MPVVVGEVLALLVSIMAVASGKPEVSATDACARCALSNCVVSVLHRERFAEVGMLRLVEVRRKPLITVAVVLHRNPITAKRKDYLKFFVRLLVFYTLQFSNF